MYLILSYISLIFMLCLLYHMDFYITQLKGLVHEGRDHPRLSYSRGFKACFEARTCKARPIPIPAMYNANLHTQAVYHTTYISHNIYICAESIY